VRRLVVLLLVLLVAVPAAGAADAKKKPPPKKKGFTPAALAGTWTGTWDNQTFNTTGTLTLTITSAGNKLGFTAAITGNTFGCTAPGPQTFTLPAGGGPNHWSPKGFSISNPSAAFGTMSVTYAYASGSLTGSGKDPACAPGISWQLTGGFAAKAFNATAHITLPGGSTATTVVSLTKK
jgi:hypothetical protein